MCIVCCDVLHLIRHTFRLEGRHDWDLIAEALRPAYTAPTEAAARERFTEFTGRSGSVLTVNQDPTATDGS